MGQWVITVAAIAILSVLCDVILPDGQTRKYIKTVMGIVVTLVIVQPVVALFTNSPDFDHDQVGSNTETYIQQDYIDSVNEKQLQAKLSTVQDILNARKIGTQIVNADSIAKTVCLQADTYYSSETESNILAITDVYLKDYDITIKWK